MQSTSVLPAQFIISNTMCILLEGISTRALPLDATAGLHLNRWILHSKWWTLYLKWWIECKQTEELQQRDPGKSFADLSSAGKFYWSAHNSHSRLCWPGAGDKKAPTSTRGKKHEPVSMGTCRCCLFCIYMPAIDRSLLLIAGTVTFCYTPTPPTPVSKRRTRSSVPQQGRAEIDLLHTRCETSDVSQELTPGMAFVCTFLTKSEWFL